MLATGNNPRVAARIADMLNEHNHLTRHYQTADIIDSKAKYFPITISDTVLASVAIERLNFLLTEIKHLVVSPSLRGLGLGKKLVEAAILRVKTPYIIASVRTDNSSSIKVFESMGFNTISLVENSGHTLKLLGRVREATKKSSNEAR